MTLTMAQLALQTISRAGIAPSYAAASGGGDQFANDGRQFVHRKNGSGSSITATFVTPRTVDGQGVADLAVAIPAGAERIVGPFPKATFNDEDGNVAITYSGVTSLTVGVFTQPAP